MFKIDRRDQCWRVFENEERRFLVFFVEKDSSTQESALKLEEVEEDWRVT